MSDLSNLKYAEGSVKNTKRIGRGVGSGHGNFSTKGRNGQKQRSGHKFRAWFEGGQMPLQRRLPKRGFKNYFKKEFQIVNLSSLQKLSETIENGSLINAEVLYKNGLISKAAAPYKILGNGELKAKIAVEAFACSSSAEEKIKSAGGTITIREIKA